MNPLSCFFKNILINKSLKKLKCLVSKFKCIFVTQRDLLQDFLKYKPLKTLHFMSLAKLLRFLLLPLGYIKLEC